MFFAFDVLVVGGGPGGCKAAELAARAGLKVAIFEEKSLGGTCLNSGCVPMKTLLYGVSFARHAKSDARKFGVTCEKVSVDLNALWRRAEMTKGFLGRALEQRLISLGVRIFYGKVIWRKREDGFFEVNLCERCFYAKRLVIAVGARPIVPEIEGINHGVQNGQVVFPENLLTMPYLPKSLIILGGGGIGLEFASLYAQLGSHVTLVDEQPRLCSSFSEEISFFIEACYRRSGISVLLNTKVQSYLNGCLRLSNGQVLKGDRILLACGRRSDVDPVDGAYIIGDAKGSDFSAAAAEMDAQIAIDGILGKPVRRKHLPVAIFSMPEIVSVGEKIGRVLHADSAAYVRKIPLSSAPMYSILHPGENGFGLFAYSGEGKLKGFEIVGSGAIELAGVLYPDCVEHPSVCEFVYESGRLDTQ